MSNDVFPYPNGIRGVTYTTVKTPESKTIVQPSASDDELRIAQWQNPVWGWQLIWEYLKNDPTDLPSGFTYPDLQILMGFFLKHQGQFDDFLFSDPTDNSVGPALISGSPNPQAQLQLVNDGAGTYYSPIQRNMGGLFYEDITDLNGAITVYANSVLQTDPANYTIVGPGLAIPGYSFMGQVIKWVAPPTAPINAQFNFYFRVRFKSDKQDFEQFVSQMFTIGGSENKNGTSYMQLKSARIAQI